MAVFILNCDSVIVGSLYVCDVVFGSGFVKLFFETFLISQTDRLGRESVLLCVGSTVAFIRVSLLFVCNGLSSPYVGIWSLLHFLV